MFHNRLKEYKKIKLPFSPNTEIRRQSFLYQGTDVQTSIVLKKFSYDL